MAADEGYLVFVSMAYGVLGLCDARTALDPVSEHCRLALFDRLHLGEGAQSLPGDENKRTTFVCSCVCLSVCRVGFGTFPAIPKRSSFALSPDSGCFILVSSDGNMD